MVFRIEGSLANPKRGIPHFKDVVAGATEAT